MSLALDDFRRLLRKGLGNLSDTDLPNSMCDELLNLALWDVEDKYPFEIKETQYTTTLVDGQRIYNVSSISNLDALSSVAVIDEEGQSKILDRMTRTWYDKNYSSSSDAKGFPSKYLREGNALYLSLTPGTNEDGLTLQLSIKESLESFSEGSQEQSGLPRNWDQIVLKKAIEFGHFFNQDYEHEKAVANSRLRDERSLVSTEAKEERDTHHGGLDVLWDFPR